jgi:hypothetical protein
MHHGVVWGGKGGFEDLEREWTWWRARTGFRDLRHRSSLYIALSPSANMPWPLDERSLRRDVLPSGDHDIST